MTDPLTVIHGDALTSLRSLESESVQTCVTSPPYWGLRDYGVDGQLGLEKTPEEYVAKLVEIFREVKRVLRKDGTCWANLGDSYSASGKGPTAHNGIGNQELGQGFSTCKAKDRSVSRWGGGGNAASECKPKDLVGIPWMVAFALRADGWYLRSDIIWSKPNPMPESVTDRPTKSHEYIFLLSKSERYFFDQDAVREPHAELRVRSFVGFGKGIDERKAEGSGGCAGGHPAGRNIRTVWTVNTYGYTDAHFATFPPDLIKPCILAGAPIGGVVLDPFAGSGTTGKVAIELGRKAILVELKAEYVQMIEKRCKTTIGLPLSA